MVRFSFSNLFNRKNETRFTKKDVLILTVGLAVFAFVSLATISASSIWFDESFSAYMISFDFAQIAQYTAADVHPPLFYWLLKIWSMLFGFSEFALRSMSVFFGAVALIFGYLLIKRYGNWRLAAFALGAAAVAPMFIRYSQEMRMYTLVAAIVMAATYVMLRASEKNKRWLWVLYGVLISLGMWTHYLVATVWLAHWAWRAWLTLRSGKRGKRLRAYFSKEWIGAHILAIVLFLPWSPSMIKQFMIVQSHGFWIPPVTAVTPVNYLTTNVFYLPVDDVNAWLTLVFAGVIGFLIWLGIRTYRSLDESTRRIYILLAIMATVPPLLLIILSLPPMRSSFIDRYLIPSSLSLALLAGITFSFIGTVIRNKFLKIGLGLAAASLIIFAIGNVYQSGNYNYNSNNSGAARQTMQAITLVARPNEPIIANSPWMFYDAVFYETPEHAVYFLDETTEYKYGSLEMLKNQDAHKIKNLKEFLADHSSVWFVDRTGSEELTVPADNLVEIQRIALPDPVTGEPAYQAVQYEVSAE